MLTALRLAVFFVSGSVSLCANAAPVWVENNAPIAGLFAAPSMESAVIESGLHIRLNSAIASHFVVEDHGQEQLFFDGESLRVDAQVGYALNDQWRVVLTLPWLQHSEGQLDSLINSWHDAWGLSDGGRSRYPSDRLRYQYQGEDLALDVTRSQRGLGDIRLELQRVMRANDEYALTLGAGRKFSRGDENALLGSGAADHYLRVLYTGQAPQYRALTWHAQLGYSRLGQSSLLAPIQRRDRYFAGVGMEWQVQPAWSLVAQFDTQSAVTRSTLDALGGSQSALLSAALRWRPSPNWSFDASVIEDIAVNTAPDVTFQLTLSWRPGA